MIKSKKGSVMIEAAIIFPIISFSVLFVIYMLINMYSQVVVNSELHMNMRDEAMRLSEVSMMRDSETLNEKGNRYSVWFPETEVHIEQNNTLLRNVIIGVTYGQAEIRGLLNKNVKKEYRSEMQIVDEEEYIRCVDVIGGITKEAV